MSTILLQRFANREYRLTHQNLLAPRRKGGDKYQEIKAEKYAIAVHDTYVLGQELKQGESASISDGRLERSSFGEVDARQALHALDIINEFQTTKCDRKKGGWGHLSKPTKFTRNARHRLLEAGAVVDAACGLNAWEITCTVPGSGNDVFRAVAASTGWIMNELTQLTRRAKCKYWFYVWEYQKRGALHIHFLIADPQEDLGELGKRLESRWWALLQLLSKKLNLDLFRKSAKVTWKSKPWKWQSHVAPIKKSVAAYFSKYAGKGSNDGSTKGGLQMVGTPSRWWGSSARVKKDIMAARLKLKWEVSPSCSKEVFSLLKEFLTQTSRLKHYSYEFDLGVTANGTNLGGGEVLINYYSDADFKTMQTWEEYYILHTQDILRRHGYADMDTQTWSNADMACLPLLYADMEQRRHNLPNADMQTYTPSPTPPNQPSSSSRKLSKSRGTQPEATLELRARLIQFLGGGVGEPVTDNVACNPAPEYIQGELFDKSCYEGIDSDWRSYEI